MRFPIRRLLVVGGGAAILATAGFAYLASNTVAPSNSGQGTGVVSGYTVSNISFDGIYTSGGGQVGTMTALNTTKPGDPQNQINTVSFKLSPDNATFVAVDLYDSSSALVGGGGASNCTETSGLWTCNVTGISSTVFPTPSNVRYVDVEASQ
jgi:hypothetical protein